MQSYSGRKVAKNVAVMVVEAVCGYKRVFAENAVPKSILKVCKQLMHRSSHNRDPFNSGNKKTVQKEAKTFYIVST